MGTRTTGRARLGDTVERKLRGLAFPMVVWALWRVGQALALVLLGGDLGDDPFRFDGVWFLSILKDGYVITDPSFATHQNPAFFPGLVWLTEPLSWAAGDRAAALVIANVTGLTAFVSVFAALRVTVSEQAARGATVVLALWPTSVVMTAFYSEGLFLTATALAIWAERSRRPVAATTAMLAAALTRTIGAAVGPVVAAVRVVRDRRVDGASVFYALTGPVGILAVTWAQDVQTGNGLAWSDAQAAWDRDVAGPWVPVWRAVDGIATKLPSPALELSLNLAAIVTVAVALVLVTNRYRHTPSTWPMLAWGWAAWLAPLCSSVPSSQVRFAMGAWPAFVVVDQIPATRRGRLLRIIAALVGVAISLVLIRRWSRGEFIG